jgi:hypothetical protein
MLKHRLYFDDADELVESNDLHEAHAPSQDIAAYIEA